MFVLHNLCTSHSGRVYSLLEDIRLCHSEVERTISAILMASSMTDFNSLESKELSTSSSTSSASKSMSLSPSASVYWWANSQACATDWAGKPWSASKGEHPMEEWGVILIAYWNAVSTRVFKLPFSLSVSLRIMFPKVWFALSQIALPRGLCPLVTICFMFKYEQILCITPFMSSGALSDLTDSFSCFLLGNHWLQDCFSSEEINYH